MVTHSTHISEIMGLNLGFELLIIMRQVEYLKDFLWLTSKCAMLSFANITVSVNYIIH